jgi:alpha-acetolactate decarboxylase
MKKIIIIFAIVFTANLSFGQSIFDKLENIDEVSSVVVNKDAFEILSKFNVKSDDNEAMEVFNMVKNLEELKVFSTDNTSVSAKMETMVKSAVSKNNLIELMRVKDKGSRVKIYVKSTKNKDFVSEVLMFVKSKDSKKGSPESVIVSLTGTIDINKMSKLADTFSKDKNMKISNK